MLPPRFHPPANTVDPVARMMRGEAGDDFGGAGIRDGTFARGFRGLAVIGELEDGRPQPLRLLELDMVDGRGRGVTSAPVRPVGRWCQGGRRRAASDR